MRIFVDPLKCESNGMCVAQAPSRFLLTDDDELVVLDDAVDEADATAVATVKAAIAMCPKQAISFVN